jgi:hypothetical protein
VFRWELSFEKVKSICRCCFWNRSNSFPVPGSAEECEMKVVLSLAHVLDFILEPGEGGSGVRDS